MDIEFRNIVPAPLKEINSTNASEIWNQNLSLKFGNKILIHAPSGKGKSTFLNIIFGIRNDFTGDLKFVSKNSNGQINWNSLRKENLSMVHQGLELFDHLTALENVNLKNEMTNFKSMDQIEDMFEKLGVLALKNQMCKTLSFGQKQRVAIIKSLCQPFSWLLLDEPFSHLDQKNSEFALQLILAEVNSQKAGILVTSLGAIESPHFNKFLAL